MAACSLSVIPAHYADDYINGCGTDDLQHNYSGDGNDAGSMFAKVDG